LFGQKFEKDSLYGDQA